MTNEEFIKSIELDNEEWRDVVGYEGLYMVSSLGRIVSLSRLVVRKYHNKADSNYITPPRLSKTFFSKSSPYERFVFYHRKPDRRLVHRIVAEAFIPNPNNYQEVDHINDNPADNRACNLQWVTPKMNSSKQHHRKALSIANKGHAAPNRTPVVCISKEGTFVKEYPSMAHAEIEGFNHSAINAVICNRRKSHGGYKWMYLSDYEKLLSISKSKNDCPTLRH